MQSKVKMTFQSRLDCGFLETLDETHDHKRSNSISAKNLIYFLSDLENNFKGYTHERFEQSETVQSSRQENEY